MTLSKSLLDEVRERAHYSCEYCSVTETDSGGLLTTDHFQPRSRVGSDGFENLLYCCFRCNLYKADYWPLQAGDASLWNPRQEARDAHLLLLADGRLYPTTVRNQPGAAFSVTPLPYRRRVNCHSSPLVPLVKAK